jgi:hypothetical protein
VERRRSPNCLTESLTPCGTADATWMLEAGADLRWVKDQLGHALIEETEGTYRHLETPVVGPATAGCHAEAIPLVRADRKAYSRAPRPLRRSRRASTEGIPCLSLIPPSRFLWHSLLSTSGAVNSTVGATTGMSGSSAPAADSSCSR